VDESNVGVILGIWIMSAFIGFLVGSNKGKGGTGFLLGLLLGVVGVIIVLVLSPSPEFQAKHDREVEAAGAKLAGDPTLPSLRSCPWCAESIQTAAVLCKHCGQGVEPTAFPSLQLGTAEGWQTDPSGRYPDRWWNGAEWTQWVRDKPGGTRSDDPPVPSL